MQRKFLKRKPYLWLYGPSLSHMLYGSKTMSSLAPLNPPIPHSMSTLARSQISPQSIYLAVKPTSTFQKSTSLNLVNTQLNVFMSVLHWKRVPTCSIIGSRGTFSNPEMLSLKNPWIEVKLMLTLIVTLTTLMALVIQMGDQRLWITKRNQRLAVTLRNPSILAPRILLLLLIPNPNHLQLLNPPYEGPLMPIKASLVSVLMRIQN